MAAANLEPKMINSKELFDEISNHVACHVCKIAPRKPPIFRSIEMGIICSDCKAKQGFLSSLLYQRDLVMEKILIRLPTSCRNKVNGCDFVQDSKFIGSHEDECQFRNVHCNFGVCVLKFPPAKLKGHFKASHGLDIDQKALTDGFPPKRSYRLNVKLTKEMFNSFAPKVLNNLFPPCLISIWPSSHMPSEITKTFFVHEQRHDSKQCFMFFVQMYGKKSEAQNYEYTIRLDDEKFGTSSYQGDIYKLLNYFIN